MGFEGFEDIEFVSEGILDGGEVGFEVGPGEREGREESGLGLEVIEGLLQFLFLGVDLFQSI